MDVISTKVERVVHETINRHSLVQKGDRIIVGLSGGPDSVCLLHVLKSEESEWGIKVYAAHLNHNLRGLKAEEDANYVVDLCKKMGVKCFLKNDDIEAYAKANKLSTEEAGRIKRFHFFEEVQNKIGGDKIALGHHKDDQAETILMRIIRGSGLDGLVAMDYRREKYIRPLLDLTKEEIENYCKQKNLKPRLDATNYETDYFRNQVRNDLIPYLKERYNPRIIDALIKLRSVIKDDYDLLSQMTEEHYSTMVIKESGKRSFPIKKITQLHPALRARLIRRGIQDLVDAGQGLDFDQIRQIDHLISVKRPGKKTSLSLGLEAMISYREFHIYKKELEEKLEFYYPVQIQQKTDIHELNLSVEVRIVCNGKELPFSQNSLEQIFDYEKVEKELNIRNRKDGDRFTPMGMNGTKKIKDFFIDLKIDQLERNRIPLLCDGDEIMWVVGYRISEKYKITRDTKKKLLIRITEG